MPNFLHPFQESQFDIFDWYPKYLSCYRFFVDYAQHKDKIQAVAASVNIKLPSQKTPPADNPGSVSLVPYIRRLVVTGFDNPSILHGFFGDDWEEGVGPIHDSERRNYLFAAKSDSWLRVKNSYDMEDGQSLPFLRPLQSVTEKEIASAETYWSDWLAMQDWMLGPRAPPGVSDPRSSR